MLLWQLRMGGARSFYAGPSVLSVRRNDDRPHV